MSTVPKIGFPLYPGSGTFNFQKMRAIYALCWWDWLCLSLSKMYCSKTSSVAVNLVSLTVTKKVVCILRVFILVVWMTVYVAEFHTIESRSSSLRSLLLKLDEASDSREFYYKLEFDWL